MSVLVSFPEDGSGRSNVLEVYWTPALELRDANENYFSTNMTSREILRRPVDISMHLNPLRILL
jgi:hypothetical protein